MSTIVCIKEQDSVVLGTDSRFVSADRSRVVSDSVEKIKEIAAGTFLATSGFSPACDFQNAKARELGQSTQDIRALSVALAEASKPILEEVAAALAKDIHLHPVIASAIAGEAVLHGAVLIGRSSSGELGYVYMESRRAGGRVSTQLQEYFGARRQVTITSATDSDSLSRFRNDWRLWSDPLLTVVSAILDHLKKASSSIGGPNQIVQLDGAGSHWISRLPVAIRQATCPEGTSTISAAISMTAPTLVITGSTTTTNIDSVNGVTITAGSGMFSGSVIKLDPDLMQISVSAASAKCVLTPQFLTVVGSETCEYSGNGLNGVAQFLHSPTLGMIISAPGLPSSSAGLSSGRIYYDAADSNRLKYVP